jgi:flavin reductase (DIM6/NTAB) family NADH-FMN oxidoreductase RutF
MKKKEIINQKKIIKIKNPMIGLFPTTLVLVSCISKNNIPNIISIGMVGAVCSEPPEAGIAIRPERYSYELISQTGEFVINIPIESLIKEIIFCGTSSGRNINKFNATKLTPMKSLNLNSPLIKECPVNLECKLRNLIELGSHSLFIGEVLTVHADKKILKNNDEINFCKVNPIVENFYEFWALRKKIDSF